MDKEDKEFMENVIWYWRGKWDMLRYIDFDIDRLRKIDWRIANSYLSYIQAKENLDFNINKYIK